MGLETFTRLRKLNHGDRDWFLTSGPTLLKKHSYFSIRDEKFRLTADNSDTYTDPDVWIVNSVFPSYESLLNRKSELEIELLDQPAFSLSVINEQRAKPTSKNR